MRRNRTRRIAYLLVAVLLASDFFTGCIPNGILTEVDALDLPFASGDVKLPTVSGDVKLPTVSGDVKLPTASGDVKPPVTSGDAADIIKDWVNGAVS